MFGLRIATVICLFGGFLVSCSQTTPHLPEERLHLRQEGWVKEMVALQTSPSGAQHNQARRLKPGTALQVESAQGDWYLVRVNDVHGERGWIGAQYLSFEPLNQQVLVQKEHEWKRYVRLSEEQLDWEQVRQLDTVSAYASYLLKYREVEAGHCIPEAIQRLEELLWPLVEMDNTFESYVIYLALFSRGPHALPARERMRALVATTRSAQQPLFWEPLRPLRYANLTAQSEVILALRQTGGHPSCTFDFGRS